MAAPVTAETTLHILHINDLHSRIQPINRFNSTCSAEDDAAGECFGGVARVATAINTLRDELTAAGENVIVLDAGDQYQGSLFFTTYRGAAAGNSWRPSASTPWRSATTSSTTAPKASSRSWTR
jgi:5'-nucleotidase/UDP-sugar diphosphatase